MLWRIRRRMEPIFSKQTNQVMTSDSFMELSQPALSAFLDFDSTNVLEIALFRFLKWWMTVRCIRAGITNNGANMRKAIGDALYKIRFPTMTTQDFANTVSTIDGFLTDSEIKQVFPGISPRG